MNIISIIIPTFNRLNTLKKVLPSYVRQKLVKEIIVIDDCSTDDTNQYMKSFSKINSKVLYFRNPTNMGQPATQNFGVSKSTGDYIFIGEADVFLPKNFLLKLYEHAEQNQADIIAGRRIWMRKDENYSSSLARADDMVGTIFQRRILTTNCELKQSEDVKVALVDASMLINRKVFTKILYDNFFKRNAWRQETEFQIQALRKGFSIYFCPHVQCFHLYKESDKGGNHNHSEFMYEFGIFKNNLYMARKHWEFLRKEFKLNYLFFVEFIYYRVSRVFRSKVAGLMKKITSA